MSRDGENNNNSAWKWFLVQISVWRDTKVSSCTCSCIFIWTVVAKTVPSKLRRTFLFFFFYHNFFRYLVQYFRGVWWVRFDAKLISILVEIFWNKFSESKVVVLHTTQYVASPNNISKIATILRLNSTRAFNTPKRCLS